MLTVLWDPTHPSLPVEKVSRDPPFSDTGVDIADPLLCEG